MEILNKPIEMIALCGLNGELRPLRFRYEDVGHHPQVVHIREIISTKESLQVGIQSFYYLCRATLQEKEQLFELRYTVKNHSWTLHRVVY